VHFLMQCALSTVQRYTFLYEFTSFSNIFLHEHYKIGHEYPYHLWYIHDRELKSLIFAPSLYI